MSQYRFIDAHNHTRTFSPDATQTLDDLTTDARTAGLSGLTLTEHYDKDLIGSRVQPHVTPVNSSPYENEWVFDIDAYFRMVREKQRELAASAPGFSLLSGIELGYLPHLAAELDQLAAAYPFDCVIASVHTFEGIDIYAHKDLANRNKYELYPQYLEQLIELAERLNRVNVLAHFDFITRVTAYPDPKFYYADFPDHFDELFRRLIRKGISLELNTRSRYRAQLSGEPDPGLPDADLIRRYSELGGEFITLSSDSHNQGEVGTLFSETAAWLSSLGVRKITHFQAGQPVWTRL